MTNQTILPTGFYDLYGKEAKAHFLITTKILNHLISNGFELFIPTALEHQKKEIYKSQTHNSFQTKQFSAHDPLSEEMIVLRNDITPQIARALSYDNKKNSKICYYGDIYRSNISSSEQRRKFTQVGFEIVDLDKNKTVSETFTQLSSLLKLIDLPKHKIVITLPSLFNYIITQINKNSDECIEKFIHLSNEVNIAGLKDNFNLSDNFLRLLTSTNIKETIGLLKDLPEQYLNTAMEVKTTLEEHNLLKEDNVICNARFDNYHENIAISITSLASNSTYIRGGDYKINKSPACGASFYIEEILSNYNK